MALILLALLAATCGGNGDGPDSAGGEIEVLAVWRGAEHARFSEVIAAFEAQSGARVTYTSVGHSVAEMLSDRVASGDAPDVAFLPQPGLLRRFAADGALVALGPDVEQLVAQNYSSVWRDLGTHDGRLYGVWFKAANKSLVWYNIAAFERAGIIPPADFARFIEVADAIASTGLAPFAVAGADAWTLTDLFENLYLRSAGPLRYDMLTAHEIPWTDSSVKHALELMAVVLQPHRVPGGPAAAVEVSFDAAVQQVFSNQPSAAMVVEGDFVAGIATGSTFAQLGVDIDAVPVPAVGGWGNAVVGGGDAAVLLRDSAAGQAFMRFLATPEAAAIWAAAGGFISPNENVDLSVYPDDMSRSIARRLLQAGDAFRFDLSDMQPSAFGGLADRGMRKALQEFLVSLDVDATAARLEAEASAALAS